jgi:hypothetical protein
MDGPHDKTYNLVLETAQEGLEDQGILSQWFSREVKE